MDGAESGVTWIRPYGDTSSNWPTGPRGTCKDPNTQAVTHTHGRAGTFPLHHPPARPHRRPHWTRE